MYLVFDLGATNTRLALSQDGRALDEVVTIQTDPQPHGYLELIEAAKRLAAGRPIKLIAGGAPGTVDRHRGALLRAPNLSNWGRVDLAGMFKLAFQAPLRLENDTALVGLGEAVAGAGESKGVMAYVTVSTGINGVRIVDGQIDVSSFGFEVGQQLIEVGNQTVTLESLVGGHALQQKYGRLPRSIDDPEVWVEERHHLAVGLYNLMVTWSPDLIVMGGSMMRDIPLGPLSEELQALPKVFPRWPELRAAKLQDLGGLEGALELIRQSQ